MNQTLVPVDCMHAWWLHLVELGLHTEDFLDRQQAFLNQYNVGTLDVRAYLRFSMAAAVRAGSTVAHQALADFVANDLVTDDLVWFTGEMVGVPSLQEGKVTRFQSWLKTKAWERSAVEVYFYSDSINDLPLLAHANHPIATNPSAALRAHAKHHGWPVLTLF